ncbi:MAG: DUF262 domain-containing protein [Deltaproteobacteria bacterium]|nr:DUF262 domain-containing protein [Deltaproteobacteria bacterium]
MSPPHPQRSLGILTRSRFTPRATPLGRSADRGIASPRLQRKYVWKGWQRWALVESILLGIPMPSFYFNEDRDGKLQVVDGVQRLTTLRKFVKGEFALEGPVFGAGGQ